MSQKYYRLISEHRKKINELLSLVHDSYAKRHSDKLAWESACKNFHSHSSAVDSYIEKVYKYKNYDTDLMEFVICFLELNPLFFRSGYHKEVMLRKLKKSPISTKNAIRLRKVIVKAVENIGLREFRAYCKLAAVIGNAELKDTILRILKTGNKSQKNRAKYMLDYITDKKHIKQSNTVL